MKDAELGMISLKDYIRMQRKQIRVRLVTPYGRTKDTFNVIKFTKANVEALINEDVKCGFYRIGVVALHYDSNTQTTSLEFRVCYFGRSDANDYSLRDRICDHLFEEGNPHELHVYDSKLFFVAWSCYNTNEARKMEMDDYNTFFTAPNVRRTGHGYSGNPNDSHDARKVRENGLCPIPCRVYVDNINQPT